MRTPIVYKYPMTEHLRLTKIMVNRAEGKHWECIKRDFTSLAEAEAFLRKAAETAPVHGGYDKCDFTLTFSDGQQYDGRIDLTNEHTAGYSISKHVRDVCEFHAGVRCPSHIERSAYENYLQNMVKPEDKAQFINWLNIYVPVLEQDCQSLKTVEAAFANWSGV